MTSKFKPPCSSCEQYKLCDSSTHRFFVAVVIILVCINCAYSYFHSRSEIIDIQEQLARELVETKRFKADLAYNTIFDIGRYESKTSELMAVRIADRIKNDYKDNLDQLQDKFKSGQYSDNKFNQMIYDVTTNSNDMRVDNDIYHSGYLLFLSDRMFHNNILTDGTFSFKMDAFADRSYNQFLSIDFINMIREHRTETLLIEPRRVNWVDNHVLIHSLTYENIYSIIENEGFTGLSGYYVVRPAYITRHGDIFNVNDFDIVSGKPNNNFKISVVSYISLYEYLGMYRKRNIDAIKVIEEEARKRATTEERNAYYNSIGTMLSHIVAIFLILNLSKILFYRNLVKSSDVKAIQEKLTDRV